MLECFLFQPGKPNNFVKECKESTLFYGNRAIKAGGDEEKAWVQSLMSYFRILEEVLKDYYPTGLVWKGTVSMRALCGCCMSAKKKSTLCGDK